MEDVPFFDHSLPDGNDAVSWFLGNIDAHEKLGNIKHKLTDKFTFHKYLH